MDYVYSATGEKRSVTYNVLSSGGNYTYCDNFIYYNGSLNKILVDGGYISISGTTPTYHYYLKDHLGNNRVVVDASGTVKQVTHYYPFGGFFGESTGGSYQSYKYNGKEFERLINEDWYDYGARHMDGMRFTTMDPMAESYYHLSPYSYCGGNPVNRIDPTGMDWYQNNQTSYYTWYDGDGAREGFTYIGGVGSLLGEFESKINNILIDVYKNNNGLYSEGRTVDITNPNKGAIFPSQLSQMDDFLDEFVFGYGPEISILTSNHPYTKALQSDARVIESQQDLRAGNTTIPGQITKVNRSWGPLDALSTTSIAKQFVGSYTFDSYTSNDKKHLLNIIYDTKNFRSLFYHIPGTGYLNHSRRSIVKPLANTYQFYIWKSKK
jgi:RHS repeat-associated protein